MNIGPPGRPISAPEPEVTHSLDLDIGEVANGHHLIVRSISLTDRNLLCEYAFVPELTEEDNDPFVNMSYDTDVSPPGWNNACSEGEVYERPAPGGPARMVRLLPP